MAKDNGDQPVRRPNVNEDIDPTANVLALVAAAITRQDDIRTIEARRIDTRYEMGRAQDHELRELDAKNLEVRLTGEARRIDALLTAAASAVSLASTRTELTAAALAERVDTSAKALAERVDVSAKTLAASVEATAKANATAVEATARALGERITILEQARYEQAGGKAQQRESHTQSNWTIERVLAIVFFLVSVALTIFNIVKP